MHDVLCGLGVGISVVVSDQSNNSRTRRGAGYRVPGNRPGPATAALCSAVVVVQQREMMEERQTTAVVVGERSINRSDQRNSIDSYPYL